MKTKNSLSKKVSDETIKNKLIKEFDNCLDKTKQLSKSFNNVLLLLKEANKRELL